MSEPTSPPASPGGPKAKSAADVTAEKIREYLATCAGSEQWSDRDAVDAIFRENFAPISGTLAKPDPADPLKPIMAAAHGMNWSIARSKPPCFHVKNNGQFCADAEHWHANGDHPFVSLSALLSSVVRTQDERCFKLEAERDRVDKAMFGLESVHEKLEAELAEVTQQRDTLCSQITEVAEAAASIGWNGVENSKILAQFIRDIGHAEDAQPGESDENARDCDEPYKTGIVDRMDCMDECSDVLHELPLNEARLVIAALATVFSV